MKFKSNNDAPASDSFDQKEPVSKADWADWVEERITETKKAYLFKPEFLLGHAKGERSIAKDYAGRELLELVQNAADAAAEKGGCGRVHIEVADSGLIVANTGLPFRAGGVRSLMTAHTSDKTEQSVTLIGAKGLGFRALLNWSLEPYILSGNLELQFNYSAAEKQVEGLREGNPWLAQQLDKMSHKPVPTLAFPEIGRSNFTNRPEMVGLITRARELSGEGYDTVVAAAFSNEKARNLAISQVREFDPNFLLFVSSISEIEFRLPDEPRIRWSRSFCENDIYELEINQDDEVSIQRWICKRRHTEIEETISGDQSAKAFEVAIAFRCDQDSSPGKLHCYFPTDMPLPFPALFHATLDLDSNRKALNAESDYNGIILSALAAFYAEVLEEITLKNYINDPMSFLNSLERFSEPLRDFESKVFEAASSRKLIKTMGGKLVSASNAMLGPEGYGTYLPKKLFGSLARCRDDETRQTLIRLGVGEITAQKLTKILRGASISIAARAKIIVGLASLPRQYQDRRLLLDVNERPLTQSNTCFPPPVSGRPPVLPRWAKAKFLHRDLWRYISNQMTVPPRERFRLLQGFEIHEFNSEGVITSLRRQTSAMLKKSGDHEKIKREMIAALFGLRESVAKDSSYPSGSTEVACKDGIWREAKEVHLSEDYGLAGKINEALYQSDPRYLLAAPVDNGLDEGDGGLIDFFRWIGVHEMPISRKENIPIRLQSRIIEALPEEFEVSDETHRKTMKRLDLSWRSNFRASYFNIVGLEGILASAPSAAILAWLGRDPRFNPDSPQPFRTIVEARGATVYRRYKGVLPDLVREQIREQPWLEVKGGKASPKDTMIAPGPLAKLFAVPRRPIEYDEEVFCLSNYAWKRGLHISGVASSLADLSSPQIFRLLQSLKKKNLEKEQVRRVYAQILDIEHFKLDQSDAQMQQFFRTGEVQVLKGKELTWAPVSEAFYLDRDNFPIAARGHFALIDIAPRRNATAIKARFGVSPLSKQQFSMTIVNVTEVDNIFAGRLRARLKEALPFIKAYRLTNAGSSAKLQQLENLELRIAVHVDMEFSIGNEILSGQIESGRHLLENNSLIVLIDLAQDNEEGWLEAVTAVCDGLAEYFELQSGDHFEKLLMAESLGARKLQLKRLLSNLTVDDLEKLLGNLDREISDLEEEHSLDPETFALGTGDGEAEQNQPTSSDSGVIPSVNPASQSPPSTPPTPAPPPTPITTEAQPITALKVTKLEIAEVNKGGGNKVEVRISSSTGGGSGSRDLDAPSDAEQWAVLFEEQQGRFPVRVSRLHGSKAFGCDCLSFSSLEDRKAFHQNPARISLVERFVEVKSGAVRLTDNEVKAAQKYRDRYYIYRFQFEAKARAAAHLTIIAHPLQYKQAVAREYEIEIDKIAARVKYLLYPN